MLSFSIVAVPLIIGYLLDLIFGDPRKLPHPIVAFGNIIGWCERHFNKGGHKKRNGCLIAIILPLSTLFLGGLLAWGSWILHPLRITASPPCSFSTAWRTTVLYKKVERLFELLKNKDWMPDENACHGLSVETPANSPPKRYIPPYWKPWRRI